MPLEVDTMSYILTARQAGELYVDHQLSSHNGDWPLISSSHKSMIAYLSSVNAPQTAATLEKELPVDSDFDSAARKKYEGLLARKWTNVMRLQRRVRLIISDAK